MPSMGFEPAIPATKRPQTYEIKSWYSEFMQHIFTDEEGFGRLIRKRTAYRILVGNVLLCGDLSVILN
jgi:hypothetical protein